MRTSIILVAGLILGIFLESTKATINIQPVIQQEIVVVKKFNQNLYNKVVSVFKDVDPILLEDILEHADRLAYEDFPRREDIISVIAVESGFRTCPTDGLGSYGLMQVNAKANRINKETLCNPQVNMIHGVRILRENYETFRSERKALLVYNAGIGNFLEGNYNDDYYRKFKMWRSKFSSSKPV